MGIWSSQQGGTVSSSDAVPEGTSNLYFTVVRALSTILTGLSLLTATPILATDTVLVALGKLQAQLNVLTPASYTNASVWGDSRCAQNWLTTVTPPALVARGWAYWFELLSQAVRFSHLNNQGVSGDSIAQLLYRIVNDVPNAYGVKPSQVPVGVAVVQIGTNSVNAGTALGAAGQPGTMLGDLNSILDYLLGRGFKVLLIAEWPRGDGISAALKNGMLTAASQKLMYAYATAIRRIDRRNCAIVDVWPIMADASRTDCVPLSGYLSDDYLHESVGAGFVTGLALTRQAAFLGLLPRKRTTSQNGDVYDATGNPSGNLIANPMFKLGAGGTVTSASATGSAPVGWTLAGGSGLTVDGSFVTIKLPNGDTVDAYCMKISGTTTAANAKCSLRQTGLVSKVLAGDILAGNVEVYVADGHVNFAAPSVLIDTGVSATQCYGGLSISGDMQLNSRSVQPFYGVSPTPDITLTTLPSTLAFEFRPMFTLSGVASSATIYLISGSMRKK